MKKKNEIKDDFTSRFKTGLTLSFERLLKSKQQSNAVLAFSEKGKVEKIKARDIKL
jgi:hypothetical protein